MWGRSQSRPQDRTACWRGLPPGHRTCAAPVAADHPACSACIDGNRSLVHSDVQHICALPLPLAVALIEASCTRDAIHCTCHHMQTDPVEATGSPQAVVQPQVRHPGRRVPCAQHDEAQRRARRQGVPLPMRADRYAAGGTATSCPDTLWHIIGSRIWSLRESSHVCMEWCCSCTWDIAAMQTEAWAVTKYLPVTPLLAFAPASSDARRPSSCTMISAIRLQQPTHCVIWMPRLMSWAMQEACICSKVRVALLNLIGAFWMP